MSQTMTQPHAVVTIEPSGTNVAGRRRLWWKRLVAMVSGCVFAALMLELLVLICVGEQAKFPRHVVEAPWRLRYNEPHARYRHKSADGTWTFSINRQGMRADRDYPYDKPAGVARIILLGDSMTAGYEVDAEQIFSSVLERELKATGLNVEVLNTGVSGFSNAEECLYLERQLIKYDPDLVVVSFFGNDLVDNVRTGLFRLDGDQLVQSNDRYVPLGRMANFLNTNLLFNLLSERSNAFVFVKEQLNRAIKQNLVKKNKQNVAHAAIVSARESHRSPTDSQQSGASEGDYQLRLAAAIFVRMHQFLRSKGIRLVVHSIPSQQGGAKNTLVEMFPRKHFDIDRPSLTFLASKGVLLPYVNNERLYRQRSHYHWTPFSHQQAGKALAKLVLEKDLLKKQ